MSSLLPKFRQNPMAQRHFRHISWMQGLHHTATDQPRDSLSESRRNCSPPNALVGHAKRRHSFGNSLASAYRVTAKIMLSRSSVQPAYRTLTMLPKGIFSSLLQYIKKTSESNSLSAFVFFLASFIHKSKGHVLFHSPMSTRHPTPDSRSTDPRCDAASSQKWVM